MRGIAGGGAGPADADGGGDVEMGAGDACDLACLRGILEEMSNDRDVLDVSFAAEVALASLKGPGGL